LRKRVILRRITYRILNSMRIVGPCTLEIIVRRHHQIYPPPPGLVYDINLKNFLSELKHLVDCQYVRLLVIDNTNSGDSRVGFVITQKGRIYLDQKI